MHVHKSRMHMLNQDVRLQTLHCSTADLLQQTTNSVAIKEPVELITVISVSYIDN